MALGPPESLSKERMYEYIMVVMRYLLQQESIKDHCPRMVLAPPTRRNMWAALLFCDERKGRLHKFTSTIR